MSKVQINLELDLNNPRDLDLMTIITHWKKTGEIPAAAGDVQRKMTPKERAKHAADARWKKSDTAPEGKAVVMSQPMKMRTQADIIDEMNANTPLHDGRAIMEGFGSMTNDEFQMYLNDMRRRADEYEIQRRGSESGTGITEEGQG